MQLPLIMQGALARVQEVLLPPLLPWQVQLSVVPQAPALKLTALPALQLLLLPPQAPLTGIAQGLVLQDWLTGPTQVEPPYCGVGLVQLRLWVPPPHGWEHEPQPLQPPLTGQGVLAWVQLALLPPRLPTQIQVALPPQTPGFGLASVPFTQLLMLALLHWPLIGQRALLTLQPALDPPPLP